MDNTARIRGIEIKPLLIKISIEQSKLLLPLGQLSKAIAQHYRQFLCASNDFSNALNQPECFQDTVLLKAFSMVKRLQVALNTWKHLYKTVEVSALIESCKTGSVMDISGDDQVLYAVKSDDFLAIAKARALAIYTKEWSGNRDPYQNRILQILWELKWTIDNTEQSRCLADIHHYNTIASTMYSPPYRIEITNGYMKSFEQLISDLERTIENYLCILHVNCIRINRAFLTLEKLSQEVYEKTMEYINTSQFRRNPAGYIVLFADIRADMQGKLYRQFGELEAGWKELTSCMSQGLLPRKDNSQSEEVIPLMPRYIKPTLNKESLTYALEMLLIDCLNEIDQKIRELVRQYARAIYIFSRSIILKERENAMGQAQVFNVVLRGAKEKVIAMANRFDAQRVIQPRSKNFIKVPSQEANTLLKIENARLEIRQLYYHTRKAFHAFGYAVKRGANVLAQGITIAQELEKRFECPKTSALTFNDLVINSRSNYWIYENTLSEDELRKAMHDQKLGIDSELSSHQNSIDIAFFILNNKFLSLLLELEFETDSLFYRCIEDILQIQKLRLPYSLHIADKVEKLKHELLDYKKLFEIRGEHHLILIDGLLSKKNSAFGKYQLIQTPSLPSFNIDSHNDYNILAISIGNLEAFKKSWTNIDDFSKKARDPALINSRFFEHYNDRLSIGKPSSIELIEKYFRENNFRIAKEVRLYAWSDIFEKLREMIWYVSYVVLQENCRRYNNPCSDISLRSSMSFQENLAQKKLKIAHVVEDRIRGLKTLYMHLQEEGKNKAGSSQQAIVAQTIQSYESMLNSDTHDVHASHQINLQDSSNACSSLSSYKP